MAFNIFDVHKYFTRGESITLDGVLGTLMSTDYWTKPSVNIRIADLPDHEREKKSPSAMSKSISSSPCAE